MRYYFYLQYRMLNRQIADLGLNPLLGTALAVTAFVGLSIMLFDRMELAVYIYLLIAISLLTLFSETKRNDFLKSCFSDHQYHLVRIVENILVILPFAFFLLLKLMILHTLLLIALAAFLAMARMGKKTNFTVPTPFGKRPFEFAVGFRRAYMVIILAYFLTFMSVSADNFNLGIFALLLIFLVCITFYLNPENEFYVWIFSLSPGRFLVGKISNALLYSTLLALPLSIAMIVAFPDKIAIIAGFQAMGYIYLATVIVLKYSAFPSQVNLPQMIILALTIWFPPALIVVAPYFYLKSVKRLKVYLG